MAETVMKGAIAVLTAPLSLALWIALAGGITWRRGRRRAASALLLGSAVLAYAFSTPLVGRALLWPLESSYPPLGAPPPQLSYVVVLGSGYMPRGGVPVTAALDAEGLVRIVEGVCLLRQLPQARLIVSGGARPGVPTVAAGYARLAQALGVAPEALWLADQARDTRGEMRDIVQRVGRAPFLLVTSASHMPRAMLLARRAGGLPVAAPTGQRVPGGPGFTWLQLVPSAAGLGDSETALHEYLGLAAIYVGLQ
jgi:uncharacterized SAM-binding protein YcdF (DUF218 family)